MEMESDGHLIDFDPVTAIMTWHDTTPDYSRLL